MFTHETDKLVGFLEGGLSPEAHRRIERHVAGCARCRAALADLRDARRTLEAAADDAPVPPLDPQLWSRVRSQVASPHRPPKVQSAWSFAAGSVAVAALVAVLAVKGVFEPTPKHSASDLLAARPSAAARSQGATAPEKASRPAASSLESAPTASSRRARPHRVTTPATPRVAKQAPLLVSPPTTPAATPQPHHARPVPQAPSPAPVAARRGRAAGLPASGPSDSRSAKRMVAKGTLSASAYYTFNAPAAGTLPAPAAAPVPPPRTLSSDVTADSTTVMDRVSNGTQMREARPNAGLELGTVGGPPARGGVALYGAQPAMPPVAASAPTAPAPTGVKAGSSDAVTPQEGPTVVAKAPPERMPAMGVTVRPPALDAPRAERTMKVLETRKRDATPDRDAEGKDKTARALSDAIFGIKPATEEGRRAFARASADLARGRSAEADAGYREALEKGVPLSETRAAHLRLGDIAVQAKDDTAALADYTAALAIAKDFEVLAKLGAVYERLGNAKKAINAYEQALIFRPMQPQVAAALARLRAKDR